MILYHIDQPYWLNYDVVLITCMIYHTDQVMQLTTLRIDPVTNFRGQCFLEYELVLP